VSEAVPRSRPSLLFPLICLALASAAFFTSARVTREMPDLEVYWRAARRAAAAEPLYRAEDQHYQFKYLPAFAMLARPLAAMPLPTAKRVWFATSVALIVLLIAASVALPVERRKPRWQLVAAIVVTMGKFYGHELVLGQVNLLFALVAVAALLALRASRSGPAGLLLALAIVIKPYAVIFVPWIAAQRRARALSTLAGGLAVALALPAITYGADGTIRLHRQWWETVTASTASNLLNQDNVSLAAMFAKWIGAGSTAALFAAVASGILLIVAAAVFVRRRGILFPEALEGALLLTLIPLLSPQGWDYVFLIATPAVVYVVNYAGVLPHALRILTVVALATIGLSLFDLMGRANYARFMALSAISVCFIEVVAALAILRARRAA
jgi:hypothetical protein